MRNPDTKRISAFVPKRLEIFLTNKCNLDCSYCSSKGIRGEGARTISFERIVRIVDTFISYVEPREIPQVTLCFTGGEPFLEFELLKKAADYLRGRYPGIILSVDTNGTLLSRQKVKALADRDVFIYLSLDGYKKANDLNRKFPNSGASVFDTVLENLRRLPARHRARIGISSTITYATMPHLTESMEVLSRLGLGHIRIGLNIHEEWTPEKIARVREEFKRFGKFCLGILGRLPSLQPGKMFPFSFDNETGEDGQQKMIFHNFAASYDGDFLPCGIGGEVESGSPEYVIGDSEKGLDLGRLKTLHSRMMRYLRKYPCPNGVFCMPETFTYALMYKLDPEPLVKSGAVLSRVFQEELGFLFDIDQAWKELAADKASDLFGHRPKYFSNKPADRLALDPAGNRGRGAAGRRAVDYFLFSGGADKTLELRRGGRPGGREAALSLVVYSLFKARGLGKNLSFVFRD